VKVSGGRTNWDGVSNAFKALLGLVKDGVGRGTSVAWFTRGAFGLNVSNRLRPVLGVSELIAALLKVSNIPKVSTAIISFLNIYFLLKIRKYVSHANQNVKIGQTCQIPIVSADFEKPLPKVGADGHAANPH
jgi:hypothetical protein